MTTSVVAHEHPILFSGPMVRAVLDGRKTQTRRVIKGAPHPDDYARLFVGPYFPSIVRYGMLEPGEETFGAWTEDGEFAVRCPYGAPGDRLWVREAHYVWSAGNNDGMFRRIAYRATEPDSPNMWTPSIHMPRWASRITLEITNVRAERVQQMDWRDAITEGVDIVPCECRNVDAYGCHDCMNTGIGDDPRHAFADLWDSINAKRGYGWDANPWVWVIEFRRIAA